MYYPHRFLQTILFLLALSSNLPLVCALKLPFGHSKEPRRRHDANTVDVKLPDMGFVKTYVCPAKADLFRRQSIPPVITLPQADLQPFLLALRETQVQMIAIIDAMLRDEGSVMPIDTCVFSSIPIPTLTPTLISTLPLPDAIPSSPLTTTSTLTTRTTTTITIFTPETLTKTRSESLDAVSTITSSQDAMDTLPVAALSTTTNPQTTLNRIPVAAPNTATNPQTTMDTVPVAALSTTITPQITLDTVPVAALSTTISVPSNLSTIVPLPSSTSTLNVEPNLQLPGYTFDASSSKNIAVYFGRSEATSSSSLEAQCADPNIDIVILAFIIPQQDGSKYPSVNFGTTCSGQTDAMRASAPGLLSCPELAGMITSCQTTHGKKVLLSMGGITGGFNFWGDGPAEAFADTLWGLFGPMGSVDITLRPFGDVEVDGFDFDNENNNPTGLATLAHTLRTHFSSSPTKKPYYLSSAPQCPFPDRSNPTDLLLQCDFVFVQFYNNPTCELGTAGFAASVKQWSDALSAGGSTAKFYLGAPAWAQAGAAAYGAIGGAGGMRGVVGGVVGMGLGNLGGVMFWDGSEGMLNVEDGKDIIAYAKEGLSS